MQAKWIGSVLCVLALGSTTTQAGEPIQVTGLASGVGELDLFDTQSGAYQHSQPASELVFPIQILDDLQGTYIIELQGQRYAIGSTLVTTNKQIALATDPNCNNDMAKPSGASRGITGKGCKK